MPLASRRVQCGGLLSKRVAARLKNRNFEHDHPSELFPSFEKIDGARVLGKSHHSDPGAEATSLLVYYRHYANVIRGRRTRSQSEEQTDTTRADPHENETTSRRARKQSLRRRWGDWIRRVFELDPLRCPCGGALRGAMVREETTVACGVERARPTARRTSVPEVLRILRFLLEPGAHSASKGLERPRRHAVRLHRVALRHQKGLIE